MAWLCCNGCDGVDAGEGGEGGGTCVKVCFVTYVVVITILQGWIIIMRACGVV